MGGVPSSYFRRFPKRSTKFCVPVGTTETCSNVRLLAMLCEFPCVIVQCLRRVLSLLKIALVGDIHGISRSVKLLEMRLSVGYSGLDTIMLVQGDTYQSPHCPDATEARARKPLGPRRTHNSQTTSLPPRLHSLHQHSSLAVSKQLSQPHATSAALQILCWRK